VKQCRRRRASFICKDRFATSKTVEALFGARVQSMIVACKRQDYDGMLGRVSDVDYLTYFSAV